jgi:hypothetical protein
MVMVMCVIDALWMSEGRTGGKGRCRRYDRRRSVSHNQQQAAHPMQRLDPHGTRLLPLLEADQGESQPRSER